MANYVKATNFTAKDSLPTGNSGKIVKGAEIDTELSAIANAVASKADINSPNLTGTPTSPTATSGSNTTQIANTAFVKAAVDTATAGLGTMSTQNANAVAITGGTIAGITDLAVADGGTGRSTLAANAVLVGNGTSGINSVAPSTSGNVLTSNGTSWTSSSSSVFGSGQEWQSVTRTAGTTYTNSTGKVIGVFVEGSTNTGADNGGYAAITVNGVLLRGTWGYTGSVPASMFAIVAPGSTYKYETFFLNTVVFREFR
jgi:hypothetical protein